MHAVVPKTQGTGYEETARRRLRSLRLSRGWTIEQLAGRSHLSASTISRIETGKRRLALDHLIVLARALDTSLDELLVEDVDEGVVIRPNLDSADGATFWMLNRRDDASGRVVAKMRIKASRTVPEVRVHPGRDWFYVLEGTVRLVLGDRELLVEAGQAAEFDTMTPHRVLGHRGPAEIITIFDHHGERAHLHDR